MHAWKYLCAAAALFFLMLPAPGLTAVDHTDKITNYEGSKTCRVCHEAAVNDITHALHYRMLGEPQGVYDYLTNKPVTGEKGKGNRY